jgi:hypothetical protein
LDVDVVTQDVDARDRVGTTRHRRATARHSVQGSRSFGTKLFR